MKIELKKDDRRSDYMRSDGKPYKLNPGGFDVFVEGTHRGRFITTSKGPLGVEYKLCQIVPGGLRGQACSEQVLSEARDKPARPRYFTAMSDKMYLLRLASGVTPVPLEDRLKAVVQEAIKARALRDPSAVAAEIEATRADAKIKAATIIRENRDRLLVKAREALAPYEQARSIITEAGFTDLANRIADALEWAQSEA